MFGNKNTLLSNRYFEGEIITGIRSYFEFNDNLMLFEIK